LELVAEGYLDFVANLRGLVVDHERKLVEVVLLFLKGLDGYFRSLVLLH